MTGGSTLVRPKQSSNHSNLSKTLLKARLVCNVRLNNTNIAHRSLLRNLHWHFDYQFNKGSSTNALTIVLLLKWIKSSPALPSAFGYLSELAHLYALSRFLWFSADSDLFWALTFKRKQHGLGAFSHLAMAVKTWNSLPVSDRHSPSLFAVKSVFISSNILILLLESLHSSILLCVRACVFCVCVW